MVNDLTGGGLTPVAAGVAPEAALNLDYFVEWRQWAWTPAVRWVLDPLSKLKGARVLELGPNRGRMSCYLALCGATVTALELDDTPTTDAEREIESWHLGHRVQIQSYDGTGENLPRGPFDFVFTKSVLVLLGDERSSFLSEVASGVSRIWSGG